MAQPDSDAVPATVGRYEVRRVIGSGGVGVVYQAHDPTLSRDIAVKVLRSDRFAKGHLAEAHERLRSEARTMARLAHPNVVTVFDVGTHDDAVFIAMELVEGPSMRDWMRSTARHWREVLAMYFRAGLGLAAAHSAGIVHRDFKPANVLVGTDGRARVTDFGLSSGAGPVGMWADSDDLYATDDGFDPAASHDANLPSAEDSLADLTVGTRTVDIRGIAGADLETTVVEGQPGVDTLASGVLADGTVSQLGLSRDGVGATGGGGPGLVAGTPAYMAPELFTGGGADARSDQFAFAVSLWEGVYGSRPFSGETAAELVEAVVAGNINEPPESRVPAWVDRIMRRALLRDPALRHESMRSMLASFAFLAKVMLD